jgi:predicted molibdopterin-dependent oxidoreductase YjgC
VSRSVTIHIDGRAVTVDSDTTVAVALMTVHAGRTSVLGERREAVCGMGICWECRARVDEVADVRTCLVQVRDGMKVETHG